MDPTELVRVPPTSQYIFAFFLEDLSTSYVVLAKTSTIEAYAVFVEPQSGKLIWKDNCVESVGQGGLISGLLPLQGLAVGQCLDNLLSTIPENPTTRR